MPGRGLVRRFDLASLSAGPRCTAVFLSTPVDNYVDSFVVGYRHY